MWTCSVVGDMPHRIRSRAVPQRLKCFTPNYAQELKSDRHVVLAAIEQNAQASLAK